MFLQITLGDVIGWIITVASVGIAVSISIRIKLNNSSTNITQKSSKKGKNEVTYNEK